ncbi:MAG: hypothetical protein ACKVI3_18525 [Verrucomicrobiia bacterium]
MRTIVGVITPIKSLGLDDPIRKETIYYSYAQRPVNGITLTSTVLNIDPELPVYQIRTLSDRINSTLQSKRTPMVLLGVFGGIAVLLASLGVYGALAFSVGQRTQELGIRMALGAAANDVLHLILRQGMWLVELGRVSDWSAT